MERRRRRGENKKCCFENTYFGEIEKKSIKISKKRTKKRIEEIMVLHFPEGISVDFNGARLQPNF